VDPAQVVQQTRAASVVEQFAKAVRVAQVEARIPVVADASRRQTEARRSEEQGPAGVGEAARRSQ
jgi:hypothetical protein